MVYVISNIVYVKDSVRKMIKGGRIVFFNMNNKRNLFMFKKCVKKVYV